MEHPTSRVTPLTPAPQSLSPNPEDNWHKQHIQHTPKRKSGVTA